MSKGRSAKNQNKDSIVNILNHKFSRGVTMYEVQWKHLRQTTWVKQQLIPKQVLDKYNNQQESSYSLSSNQQHQQKKKPDPLHGKHDYSSESDDKKENEKSKIKTRLKSKGKKSIIEISSDTFFNEGQSSFKKSSKRDQSQKQRSQKDQDEQILAKQQIVVEDPQPQQQLSFKQQEYVQVVAEAQSSSDDEDQSQNSQEGSEEHGNMHMKQPKAKVSKTKGKKIRKKNKILQRQIDEDNMLISRHRDLQKKNYKEAGDIRMKQRKTTINFSTVQKQFNKAEYVESLLISTVLESGMSGPYKFYLVKLRNNDNVYIREKNMRHYFPRKLLDYYQRILNKVAKGTNKLNFAV